MPRWTIALWSGLAGVIFGTFQSSFPADLGGPGGLLLMIVLVIPPLGWTFECLRRRVRRPGVKSMQDQERSRWGGPWRRAAFYGALAVLLLVAMIGLARALT